MNNETNTVLIHSPMMRNPLLTLLALVLSIDFAKCLADTPGTSPPPSNYKFHLAQLEGTPERLCSLAALAARLAVVGTSL